MKKDDVSNVKKSVWGELGLMSGMWIAFLILIIVGCIAIYAYMIKPTDKVVVLTDDAKVFSKSEEKKLKEAAKDLSRDEDVNVIIVTTKDKEDTMGGGYYSDDYEGCGEFTEDYYHSEAITSKFRDNSGICLCLDLSNGETGKRHFRIMTYGTAYYTITNDECDYIAMSHRNELSDGDYAEAILGVVDDISEYDFESGGVTFMKAIVVIVPGIIALIVAALMTKKKKLDKAPKSRQYLDSTTGVKKTDGNQSSADDSGLSAGGIFASAAAGMLAGALIEDIFLRQKSVTTHHSSGGGGGFGGGGGGGGHSGGGGCSF